MKSHLTSIVSRRSSSFSWCSPSGRSPRGRSCAPGALQTTPRKVFAVLFAAVVTVAAARAAEAGVRAALYIPPPPPSPAGPVGAALTNAYRATIGASSGPSALAANTAYLRALQAAARGDESQALAAAAEAQARALSVSPLPAAVALPSFGEAAAVPQAQGVPIVSAGLGAAGDPDLGRASNQIAIAEQSGGGRIAVDRAKAHYRAALDAYVDGNAAKTKREADAAFDLATDAITRR